MPRKKGGSFIRARNKSDYDILYGSEKGRDREK